MKKSTLLLLSLFSLMQVYSAFAIKPDREYIKTPKELGWPYEELKIKTEDGYSLNSWIYQANKKNDKDTVLILAYPDAGNMSYFVFHAAILANSGYTVVTFDYRGFGHSDDFEINPDYLYYKEFVTDLESVTHQISEKFANKRIGLWGMSMGTTVMVRAYPAVRDQVDFMIGEGMVTEPKSIVSHYKAFQKNLLLPEDPAHFKKAIESIACPLLIFAASEDQITPFSAAEKLKLKLGNTCEIIQYEGEHLSSFHVEYESKGFGGWFTEQTTLFVTKI